MNFARMTSSQIYIISYNFKNQMIAIDKKGEPPIWERNSHYIAFQVPYVS